MLGIGWLTKLTEVLYREALKEQEKQRRAMLVAEAERLQREGRWGKPRQSPIIRRSRTTEVPLDQGDAAEDTESDSPQTVQSTEPPQPAPLTMQEPRSLPGSVDQAVTALISYLKAYAEYERRRSGQQ